MIYWNKAMTQILKANLLKMSLCLLPSLLLWDPTVAHLIIFYLKELKGHTYVNHVVLCQGFLLVYSCQTTFSKQRTA